MSIFTKTKTVDSILQGFQTMMSDLEACANECAIKKAGILEQQIKLAEEKQKLEAEQARADAVRAKIGDIIYG